MKRYAFIDVQNTETTASKVLKFEIDHEKLYYYLKSRWNCEKVFFYPGIKYGDEERDKNFRELTKLGAIVRPKYYSVYKNKDKNIINNCSVCGSKVVGVVDMGYNWKCNCDVELTADVLGFAHEGDEIIIFSGDGDFEFLINKLLDTGCAVLIVASYIKSENKSKKRVSRLSTRLKNLIKFKGDNLRLLELNNLKFKIQKEKAAKRDFLE